MSRGSKTRSANSQATVDEREPVSILARQDRMQALRRDLQHREVGAPVRFVPRRRPP